MTPIVLLPWQLSFLKFLSVKKQISPFATLVRQRVLLGTDIVSILSKLSSLDWVG